MKKRLFIIVFSIALIFSMLSCTSSRLVSYKPNKNCSTYNDGMSLDKRQDIPRSLRMDYKPYKYKH